MAANVSSGIIISQNKVSLDGLNGRIREAIDLAFRVHLFTSASVIVHYSIIFGLAVIGQVF